MNLQFSVLMSFASGGRQRLEMAALPVEDFVDQYPMRSIQTTRTPLPCLSIRLRYTKTTTSADGQTLAAQVLDPSCIATTTMSIKRTGAIPRQA